MKRCSHDWVHLEGERLPDGKRAKSYAYRCSKCEKTRCSRRGACKGRTGEQRTQDWLFGLGAVLCATFRCSRAKRKLPDGSIVECPLDQVALFPDGRVMFVETKTGTRRMSPADREAVRELMGDSWSRYVQNLAKHGVREGDGILPILHEYRWPTHCREPIVRDLTKEE